MRVQNVQFSATCMRAGRFPLRRAISNHTGACPASGLHSPGLRQCRQEGSRVLPHSPIHLAAHTVNQRSESNIRERATESARGLPPRLETAPLTRAEAQPETVLGLAVCSEGQLGVHPRTCSALSVLTRPPSSLQFSRSGKSESNSSSNYLQPPALFQQQHFPAST